MLELLVRRCPLPATIVGSLLVAGSAGAASPPVDEPRHELSFEVKGDFRSSDANAFRVSFPFPPELLPPGQTVGLESTVDPGDHLELAAIIIEWRARVGSLFESFVKIDGIDRFDRNPTSSDYEIDLDEAWVRFGRETPTARLADRPGGYVRLGKFAAIERQDDRHLESYGLVSTAFNRFETAGIEVGTDLGRHFYVKAAFTDGNPVFLRDPNALAGDNGTPEERLRPPLPRFGTGIAIPYDAEVELDDLQFDEPEASAALGFRFSAAAGQRAGEVMAWHNQRNLAETVKLHGTFYGGDLDLLRGPTGAEVPFPLTSNKKEETGGNLWLYLGSFTAFAQVVDQDLGGLGRFGVEAELAWRFDLPLWAAARGRQILPSIQPAVRYSHLDPDYRAPAGTPSPSFAWDWEKWDYGVRIGLFSDSDLTVEYARNRFILGSGREAENDELLVTLRLRFHPIGGGRGGG